jgi:hypothetical protein
VSDLLKHPSPQVAGTTHKTVKRVIAVSRWRGGLPERGEEQPAAQAARAARPGAGRIGAGG